MPWTDQAEQAVRGLPRPFGERNGWPFVVAVGYSNADASSKVLALGSTLRRGDIIFANFASQQAGGPSISGGGAVWTLISQQSFAGGAQVDTAMWMGRVVADSAASISYAWTNTGGCAYVAFRGLDGVLRGSAGIMNSAGGSTTAATIYIPNHGVIVASVGARGSIGLPTVAGHTFHTVSSLGGLAPSTLSWAYPIGGPVSVNASGGTRCGLIVATVT